MSREEAKQWGAEWSEEYVKSKLQGLSTTTTSSPPPPEVDAYEKAAAVLEYFDPSTLNPVPGETASNKRQLLANSTVVSDPTGQPRSMLQAERRRTALQAMQLQGIREALAHNPRPNSSVQKVFESYVTGTPSDLGQKSLPEL